MSNRSQSRMLTVLLTATIDPGKTPFTKRIDPRQREDDYISVIQALGKSGFAANISVVFCENSGSSLFAIEGALRGAGFVDFEAISFSGNDGSASRGKGYGEMKIIEYAFAHSRLLQGSDIVVKITGRYEVKNIDVYVGQAIESGVLVLSDFKPDAPYTYSGLFLATPRFFKDFLIPLAAELDDVTGMTMEKVLHRAVVSASAAGFRSERFKVPPVVSGVSGTWNVPIDKNNFNAIAPSFTRLRIVIRAYARALARRLRRLI